MATVRLGLFLCLSTLVSGCAKTRSIAIQKPASTPSSATRTPKKSLSEIDISKIGQIAPKGRVQDKDYNDLEVIDQLIANGKDSIPFLISKLDDGKVIRHHGIDYWPGENTVGDVAFVILSDFVTDSTWSRTTISGADDDSILGKSDPGLPGVERLSRFVEKHGRKQIQQKWEKIWTTYKDRIVWDDKERCFKVV